jgi:hypothetical protein
MRLFLLALATLWFAAGAIRAADSLIQVDQRRLVSRADLVFDTPASRSEEGMPIGTGRMGTLVWTTPSALKLQINRVDVHAMDSTTVSFPRADSDYGSVCGFVDINVVDAGADVFTGPPFRQHLSMYEGLMTAQGSGLTARALAWPDKDVIAFEIEDAREQPAAINIDLRMLRYQMQYHPRESYTLAQANSVVFRTAGHTATSTLAIHDAAIALTQQFREHSFYGASALAIRVAGRPSRARYLNQSTVQLSAAPGKGRFVIVISSAASKTPSEDVTAVALDRLSAGVAKGF